MSHYLRSRLLDFPAEYNLRTCNMGPPVTRWRDDMWLKIVTVRNFRSIENLPMPLDRRASVIVGPNAIGKTTLLEAIRLAKAALAPRTQNETQQVLIGLGALSPHNPNYMNYGALARDLARQIEIDAEFALTASESQALDGLVPEIATAAVRARLGPAAQGPLGLVQFFSSPAGAAQLATARKGIETGLRL